MTIQTTRLVLRPLEFSDCPAIQLLAGDRDVSATTRDIEHPYEDGMAEKWVSSCQWQSRSGNLVHFAITLANDATFIGAITLHLDPVGKQAELSYWVGKPFWNQGYATEAVESVLRHGLTKLGLDRVYGAHFTRNPASGRVMQKAGMCHEGFLTSHTEKWGKLEDLELYAVSKERFLGGYSG